MAHRIARLGVISGWVVVTGLTTGWFATGHASAPDDGLLQLDVLSLDERVPGLTAAEPTLVIVSGEQCPRRQPRLTSYPVVFRPDLAEALALPRALSHCQDGYVLLDATGAVRYRTYDPGWPDHAEEQEVLLDHLAHHG